MAKIKKRIIILLFTLVMLVVITILFISPITKYLIEKYDEKYIGRQITLDRAYVNPFTGYVYFNNFKIYELKSDRVFLSTKSISANFSIYKLLYKNYEITELVLNEPKGIIIQKGSKHDLNFKDIIEKFSTKGAPKKKGPVHFSILSIKINEGEFHFQENAIPVNYYIKKVNIESSGIFWNADTIAMKFSFLSGIGRGDIKGNLTINSKSKDYRLAVNINKFDLNIVEQYLKDLINYGSFSASLNANIKAKGNFNDKENVTANGTIAINDFHFGKTPKEDYASFDKVVVTINELSPKYHKYLFDSITLTHPYFKYERYDYLDNFQKMFGKKGSKISAANSDPEKFNLILEIAHYVDALAKNFFRSNYTINKIAINNGDIKFNDYSISEKFSIALNPFYFYADSINKNYKRVNASFKSGIKPYGNLAVNLSINPKNEGDFELNYHLKNLPITMFNPYIISFTSFPLNRGGLELYGKWDVKNSFIKSNNHLVAIDPRINTRLKNKDTKWLPLRLIMYFIREGGNVIDYEIPITGNLKNPKFNLKDIIFDALENTFVKPITAPHRLEVKNTETEIEKSLTLNWEMRNSSLSKEQELFIEKMTRFLLENPQESIVVHPNQYSIKEKEYILFFEAKKKYYLHYSKKSVHSFTEEDSAKVDKMSAKDSVFVHFLNKQVKDSMLFTVQARCEKYLGLDAVNDKFKKLNTERVNAFMNHFKEKGIEKQIKIAKEKSVVPYNGFSFFKIEYKGELPEYLLKAYQKMNELNDEAPRNKFKRVREKTKGIL